MQLGLGSVQFGLDYGISNRAGQTPAAEVARILRAAIEAGIKILDTAAEYGNAEEVLGQNDLTKFKIVTKTAKFREHPNPDQLILETFQRSLNRLDVERVYGLLFHDPRDLLGEKGALGWTAAQRLRDEGRVQKIGVSVYTAAEVDALLEKFPDIRLVQLPLNLVDQRLFQSGKLKDLKSRGIEIHVRSAFFQGLLLMEPDQTHAFFSPLKTTLRNFHSFAKKKATTPIAACLKFLETIQEADHVICGVNTTRQLDELIAAHRGLTKIDISRGDFSNFACTDHDLLNPLKWPNFTQKGQ